MSQRIRKLSPLILILALALITRLALTLITPGVLLQDYKDYFTLAARVADGQGFVSAAGPTTFRPPGYPFALAGLFVLFGKSLLVVRLFNTLLGVLSVYLTYDCARRVFDPKTALTAALLTALMPNLIFFTGLAATENLSIPLFLLGVIFFLKAMQEDRPLLYGLSGVVLGLAALVRPTNFVLGLLLPFYLLIKQWTAHKWAVRDWAIGRLVGAGLLLWAGLFLAMLPWIARNYRVSGHFIPTVTNGGMNMLISFSDDTQGYYSPLALNRYFGARYNWSTNLFDGLDLDEYEIDQQANRAAVDYIREHPWRSLALAPGKLYYLLRDSVSGVYENLFDDDGQFLLPQSYRIVFKLLQGIAQGYYILLMLLMLVGMFHKGLYSRYPDALLILAFILFMVATHAAIYGADRYHLPYVPFFSMFSAAGLLWVLRRFELGRAAQPTFSGR